MLPGRRLELQRKHRLHRIDDHERRLDARDLVEDALEARLGQQVQRRVADGEPLAARLDLMLGLLAGAVEHGPDRARHVRRRLEQQRRLADARFTAEEHQRPRDHTAAEHAIELSDAGRQPFVVLDLDVRVQAGARRVAGARVAVSRGLAGLRLGPAPRRTNSRRRSRRSGRAISATASRIPGRRKQSSVVSWRNRVSTIGSAAVPHHQPATIHA